MSSIPKDGDGGKPVSLKTIGGKDWTLPSLYYDVLVRHEIAEVQNLHVHTELTIIINARV